MPPCSKTERVLQIGKMRMRFALVQTCQFFALSVICFANASSPKGRAEKSVRTFCPYAQSKLVSPFGRDVAQRQRGLVSADMAFQICPDTGFFVFRTKQKRAQICTLFFGGRWWIRFSAEKPRRLQHASSMLPRAGFRIHCSHSKF